MNKLDLIKEYFNGAQVDLNITNFALDILLTSVCAFILSKIYEKYGRSLSNRTSFAQNFLLLSLTTMMVISIIRSSIALSLGLVGALSIVRFRSAIKDPEELVYLFLTMGIGLGFGSGNRYVTALFFLAICAILILKGKFDKVSHQNQMFLFIKSSILDTEKILEMVGEDNKYLELNRLDSNKNTIETIFTIKPENFKHIAKITETIKSKDPDSEISFTENKGILS